jgi:hypothetical protein
MLDEGYFVEYINSDSEESDNVDGKLDDKESRGKIEQPAQPSPLILKMSEALANMFKQKMEEAKQKESKMHYKIRQSLSKRVKQESMGSTLIFHGDSMLLAEEDDLNRIPLYEIKDFSRRFRQIKEDYFKEKQLE